MRTALFILLACVLLTGCDNDDVSMTNKLAGQWDWKSSCGGVVGCVYASDMDIHTMTVTNSSIEISDNGNITFSKTYLIKKVTGTDNAKTYEIEFSDRTTWTAVVKDNKLTTEFASVIFSVYERQK